MVVLFFLLLLFVNQNQSGKYYDSFTLKSTTGGSCKAPFQEFHIKDCPSICFTIYEEPRTFLNASKICAKSESGELYWMSQACEHYSFLLLASTFRSKFLWIGMKRDAKSTPAWMHERQKKYFISKVQRKNARIFAAASNSYLITGIIANITTELPFICRAKI